LNLVECANFFYIKKTGKVYSVTELVKIEFLYVLYLNYMSKLKQLW